MLRGKQKARIDCWVGKSYCQAGNPVKLGVQKVLQVEGWVKRPQTVSVLDEQCKAPGSCWLVISEFVCWLHTRLAEGPKLCRYGMYVAGGGPSGASDLHIQQLSQDCVIQLSLHCYWQEWKRDIPTCAADIRKRKYHEQFSANIF